MFRRAFLVALLLLATPSWANEAFSPRDRLLAIKTIFFALGVLPDDHFAHWRNDLTGNSGGVIFAQTGQTSRCRIFTVHAAVGEQALPAELHTACEVAKNIWEVNGSFRATVLQWEWRVEDMCRQVDIITDFPGRGDDAYTSTIVCQDDFHRWKVVE